MGTGAVDNSDVPPPALLFGHARWDPTTRRLSVRSEPVKVSWKVAECLRMLVEARGEIVTKEEFQREVWNSAALEESSVAQCVTALRKVLDPAPYGGSHIETVPRIGYRLAVPVVEEKAQAPPGVERGGFPRWAVIGICVAALCLMAGGAAAYRRMERVERVEELLENARSLMRRSNVRDGVKATSLIQEALSLMPEYPPGLAAYAEATARFGRAPLPIAMELGRLAVKGDPQCGECSAVLGYILGVRGWQWEEAGRHLARAVARDPHKTHWRLWYADWLAVQSRLDEAWEHAEAASKLEPAEPRVYSTRAFVRYFQGKYREAIAKGEKATALSRFFQPAHYWIYRSYLELGEDLSAIVSRGAEVNSWSGEQEVGWEKFHRHYVPILEQSGRVGVARAWLHEVSSGTPLQVHRYNRAFWYMWIGEHENALAELEAGIPARTYHLIYVAADPAFAPLRGNPRFQEVVRRVGLKPPAATSD